MEVVVSSREIIKPSRATPPHLRRVPLCFLDQLNAQIFAPFIYFYSHPTNHSRLKKSLSETLSRYYPLAGRLKDDSVDCNDDGVPYFEATVVSNTITTTSSLRKIIEHPDSTEIRRLLPYSGTEDPGELLLAVQVNEFDCGGLAVGICLSRKFMDAYSIIKFVSSWADITRGQNPDEFVPTFNLSTVFPPYGGNKIPPTGGGGTANNENEETHITKWFVVSSESMSLLKRNYNTSHPDLKQGVTRVEALSAFLWTRFLVSNHGEDNQAKEIAETYRIVMGVNLRPRADPPLSEECFGNASRFAIIAPSMEGKAENGFGLVRQMRDAVSHVDGNYVKRLQEGDPFPPHNAAGGGGGGRLSIYFASLGRYSLYGADFGFGNPIWTTAVPQLPHNVIHLMPTGVGDGVEVSLHLKKDQLSILEADIEFQAYVSPSMSSKPLHSNSSL